MATSEAIDALTALAAEYEQDANLLRRTLAIVRHHLSRKYDWHGDTKGLMPLMSLALAGELAERLKPIPGVCAGDSVVVLAKAASQIMQLGSSCAGAARARKLQFTFLHVAAVRIVDGIPWVTVDGDLEIPVTGCAVLS